MQAARVIGGAGTGKTRMMLGIAEKAMERPEVANNPFAIGFSSFTRAARMEASGRAAAAWGIKQSDLERDGWFRTVHSVAYRVLGVAKGEILGGSKEDDKWVSEALGSDVQASFDEDEGGVALYVGDPVAAASLNYWSVARSMVVPLRQVVEADQNPEAPGAAEVIKRIEAYEQAKRLDGRIDFTDLLCRFVGVKNNPDVGPDFVAPDGVVPNEVVGWIFDEAQDASAILDMACKRLVTGDACKWAWLVGDPFQCQPEGTPVLTTKGYRPIESLDEERDWLIAFNRDDSRFRGFNKQVKFQKASRTVDSGELIEVTLADGTKHIATENHKWLARTHRGDWWATYLMRQGTRWRIGTVQMFANFADKKNLDKNGEFRLNNRFNQEQAEEAWILRAFPTDREARLHEQIASFKFGIPQVTFRPPCGCRNNLDQEFIDRVFEAMGDLEANAQECLKWHGLCRMFPYRRKADRQKNGRHASRFIETCNIIPNVTALPRVNDNAFDGLRRGRKTGVYRTKEADEARRLRSRATWVPVVSVRRLPAGTPTTVWSLNVETHHTYITNNRYITGNCLYGWAGSKSDYFMSWDVGQNQKVMPKSYRCAPAIMALGERCLMSLPEYWDRGIAPADHDGEVVESENFEDDLSDLDPREETLVIARTNRNVSKIAAILDDVGVPFRRVKAKQGAYNKDMGMTGLWKLQHGMAVTGDEWGQAIELLPSKTRDGRSWLVRGSKSRWSRELATQFDLIFTGDLPTLGATEHLQGAIASGEWAGLVDGGTKWAAAAKRFGLEAVSHPKCRIGTIHSVKGQEADNVIVLSSKGRRIYESEQSDPERAYEERRIEYVAATRARKRLTIAHDPRERYRMEFPL